MLRGLLFKFNFVKDIWGKLIQLGLKIKFWLTCRVVEIAPVSFKKYIWVETFYIPEVQATCH